MPLASSYSYQPTKLADPRDRGVITADEFGAREGQGSGRLSGWGPV